MKSPNNFPAVFTPKSIAFLEGVRKKISSLRLFCCRFKLVNSTSNLRVNFTALILLFSQPFFSSNSLQAADLKVCKTCNFKTVTSAVKAAKPNDRILVQRGYYAERNIEIKKPLQLIGIG